MDDGACSGRAHVETSRRVRWNSHKSESDILETYRSSQRTRNGTSLLCACRGQVISLDAECTYVEVTPDGARAENLVIVAPAAAGETAARVLLLRNGDAELVRLGDATVAPNRTFAGAVVPATTTTTTTRGSQRREERERHTHTHTPRGDTRPSLRHSCRDRTKGSLANLPRADRRRQARLCSCGLRAARGRC